MDLLRGSEFTADPGSATLDSDFSHLLRGQVIQKGDLRMTIGPSRNWEFSGLDQQLPTDHASEVPTVKIDTKNPSPTTQYCMSSAWCLYCEGVEFQVRHPS